MDPGLRTPQQRPDPPADWVVGAGGRSGGHPDRLNFWTPSEIFLSPRLCAQWTRRALFVLTGDIFVCVEFSLYTQMCCLLRRCDVCYTDVWSVTQMCVCYTGQGFNVCEKSKDLVVVKMASRGLNARRLLTMRIDLCLVRNHEPLISAYRLEVSNSQELSPVQWIPWEFSREWECMSLSVHMRTEGYNFSGVERNGNESCYCP